jgi:hypothetical protein
MSQTINVFKRLRQRIPRGHSPIMKCSLTRSRSVHWNIQNVLLPCINVMNIWPDMKLLTQIWWRQPGPSSIWKQKWLLLILTCICLTFNESRDFCCRTGVTIILLQLLQNRSHDNETLRISNFFFSFLHIYTHIIRSFLTISPLPPLTMLGECFN